MKRAESWILLLVPINCASMKMELSKGEKAEQHNRTACLMLQKSTFWGYLEQNASISIFCWLQGRTRTVTSIKEPFSHCITSYIVIIAFKFIFRGGLRTVESINLPNHSFIHHEHQKYQWRKISHLKSFCWGIELKLHISSTVFLEFYFWGCRLIS